MIGLRLFGDDQGFEAAYYEANDRRKFVQRRTFMFLGIITYALFGFLDPLMGGDTASVLIGIRVVTVILMSYLWAKFAKATGHQTREFYLFVYSTTITASILTMIVCASGPAADYYPFAIGVIQIFGGGLVVPQFRTMAITCIAAYTGFWLTVGYGETSLLSLYASGFLLTVTTLSVIVGSYARESLERDQKRKEYQLANARDEALRMGEAAIKANEAKNHMLANISHELRTPMNAILGFSEAMKLELYGKIEQPKYREYIADIHRSGGILLSNINDLLDLARIEAGKMGWHETVFEVADAMQTAAKASTSTLFNETIRIVWTDESGGARMRGDYDRLCQAMINLLNNAGKFSPPGGTIGLTFTRAGNDWAIRVVDEGCGIPEKDLQRIREPFAQVGPDGYSAAKGGLGLGLAITGEIMRRLDGEIVIDSVLDFGTTVTLALPAHRIIDEPQRLIA